MVNTFTRAAAYLINGCSHPIAPVVEGQVYRSGQLSGEGLGRAIDRYGLKSIINLRGVNLGKEWYTEEMAVAEGRGAVLASYPMCAKKPTEPECMSLIMRAVESLPRPLLVHCWGGADRTGVISAFVKLKEGKRHEARDQIGMQFLHVGFGRASICDRIVESACNYEGKFDEWLAVEYPKLYDRIAGEVAAPSMPVNRLRKFGF